VHPDGAEEDHVKPVVQLVYPIQSGKPIVHPVNRWMRMSLLGLLSHLVRRLDRNDLIPPLCKPGRVSARPGSHVEDQEFGTRQERQPATMHLSRLHRLVAIDEGFGVLMI
jgi:hypothetical protein